jgi:hypothetical protein
MLSDDRGDPVAPQVGVETELTQPAVALGVSVEWRDRQAVDDERANTERDRRKRVLAPIPVV